MEKEKIIKILNDWNFWDKEIETGVRRDDYLERLKQLITDNQIITITGARRSGKSFIMRQLAKELIESKVNKENILLVNLEDPRFSNLSTSLLSEIYDAYLEFRRPKDKSYIFLDEIQEVEKWEKWVLSMQELKKAHLIISGSNAKLLSRELSTLLTGRHLDITVLPISFKEFLKFNNVFIKSKLDFISQEIEIKSFFRDYLEKGGFPEVVLRDNKREILLTYFKDILEKDLIKRYKIRKSEGLKELLNFYFSNVSSLITFSSLEKSLKISADTIEKFSSYFENAYLLFFLKRFSFKVKEQEKSPRKVYAIDTGLVNAVGFRFSENLGKLAENIAFLELQRKKLKDSDLAIYYWKDENHQEVDFVIKNKNLVTQLLQICWDLSDIKTREREIKSLIKASEELSCQNLLIITSDYEGEEKIKGKIIKFIPLYKWLLED